MEYIENHTFDEIEPGATARMVRTLTRRDIELFAVLSGDFNPTHLDEIYAREDPYHQVIGHSIWGGTLVSGILGTLLPGAGTLYRHQSLTFEGPVRLGDAVEVSVTVTAKDPADHTVTLDCEGRNQDGERILWGQAVVVAPTTRIRRPRIELPEIHMHEHGARHKKLVEMTSHLEPVPTAVVHPVDRLSLEGAVRAAEATLIRPLLVGPEARIRAAAEAGGLDIGACELVDVPHSHAAAARGVELVRCGRAAMLMKGSLHTDELMAEVVSRATGLRTERRISHVFVLDVPTYPRPLLITDAAINIYPGLMDKRDIVQNAIDLAHAMGVAQPRVAILSAVETVTPKIASTMEAAALCKMAERGQIRGGILDGPLAFDNAISRQAATTKGIVSPVAGEADILVVPDLEAGNMVAKQLEYLADAAAAGVVVGARVPIVLTSRSDGLLARLASCAVAVLMARAAGGRVA